MSQKWARCVCGKPSNHLIGTISMCCRCYVLAGNPPADWHSECMQIAESKRRVTTVMPIVLENTFAGSHISTVCEAATKLADEKNSEVTFEFNGTPVLVQPGESVGDVEKRWTSDMEAAAKAWRESPEYAAQEAARAEQQQLKESASMKESATTEAAMRDTKAPWPQNRRQLDEYIDSLVEREHDYGTCVYAMSLAAEAAFNYVAHKLGTTGFQSSCADLDFIRRTRSIEGPFILLNGQDCLYPQYNLREKLEEALQSWDGWLKEEATKKLADADRFVSEGVKQHWEKLAKKALD